MNAEIHLRWGSHILRLIFSGVVCAAALSLSFAASLLTYFHFQGEPVTALGIGAAFQLGCMAAAAPGFIAGVVISACSHPTNDKVRLVVTGALVCLAALALEEIAFFLIIVHGAFGMMARVIMWSAPFAFIAGAFATFLLTWCNILPIQRVKRGAHSVELAR